MPCSSSNWFSLFMRGCRDCRQSWLLINVSPQPGYGWTAHWWAVYNMASLNARRDGSWWDKVAEIKKRNASRKWWYVSPMTGKRWEARRQNYHEQRKTSPHSLRAVILKPQRVCDRRAHTEAAMYPVCKLMIYLCVGVMIPNQGYLNSCQRVCGKLVPVNMSQHRHGILHENGLASEVVS